MVNSPFDLPASYSLIAQEYANQIYHELDHKPLDRLFLDQLAILMKRLLKSAGVLLLAFHIGDETLHLDEWRSQQVYLDYFHHPMTRMLGFVQSAGFEILKTVERAPYLRVEHPSCRGYIFAQKAPSSVT